eukprot:TRINITY_DN29425_c0_g1_i1.p1 TRINITY_DN29425_c0_g1~~TRINITY_DN29425_c0_g1_i1.p1  ORF type:complete len:971 (+),score=209.61 TRINITY_DN29425_c0_g1_i1:564-3476(+)
MNSSMAHVHVFCQAPSLRSDHLPVALQNSHASISNPSIRTNVHHAGVRSTADVRMMSWQQQSEAFIRPYYSAHLGNCSGSVSSAGSVRADNCPVRSIGWRCSEQFGSPSCSPSSTLLPLSFRRVEQSVPGGNSAEPTARRFSCSANASGGSGDNDNVGGDLKRDRTPGGSSSPVNQEGTAKGGKSKGGNPKSSTSTEGTSGGDASGSSVENRTAKSSNWDLAARRRRLQEAALKIGDPFRDMMSTASRKFQDYMEKQQRGAGGQLAAVERAGGKGQLVAIEGKASEVKESALESEMESGKEGGKGPQEVVEGGEELALAKEVDDVEEFLEKEKNTEWSRWEKVFARVDEKYALLEALKFQMDLAVEEEDFKEAARVKKAFDACAEGDVLGSCLAELERALKEERYGAAARLRDETAIDLVGWWAALGEGSDDPMGCLVNIAAMRGRLVARSYGAKQLTSGRQGTPLFEVFVDQKTDDPESGYCNQPVYLRKPDSEPELVPSLQRNTVLIGNRNRGPDGPTDASGAKGVGANGIDPSSPEGGIQRILDTLDSLKERIQGMNTGSDEVQVIDMRPTSSRSNTDEAPSDAVNQVLQKIAEAAVEAAMLARVDKGKKGGAENRTGEQNEKASKSGEVSEEEEVEEETSEADGDSEGDTIQFLAETDEDIVEADVTEDGNDEEPGMKVSVHVSVSDAEDGEGGSGALGSMDTAEADHELERVPARIERRGRDNFLFQLEKDDAREPSPVAVISSDDGWKISATVTVGGAPGATPNKEAASKMFSGGNVPLKRTDVEKIVKQLMQRRMGRRALSKTTSFRRLDPSVTNTDPLAGLYFVALALNMYKVVQLRRKFGRWEGDMVDAPYEYVEAVKVIGDPFSKAGEITFRAKVGRHHRLSASGVYPDEMGVVARYKGQGRLAQQGENKDERWVDGEMVLLNGKGLLRQGSHEGASLGFVYTVEQKNVLVLFNRIMLPA